MKKKIIFLSCLALAAALVLKLKWPWFLSVLESLMDWVGRQGVIAPVLFVLVYVSATLLFLPLLIFTLSGGFLFGGLTGTLAVCAATLLSAVLSFLFGRYGPRDFLLAKLKHSRHFQQAEAVVQDSGWKIVILSRLSTLFPFTLLNFLYGLSKIRFRDYFLCTFIGMLPGNYIFASLGAAAGTWLKLEERARFSGEGPLFFASVFASLTASILMLRLIQRTEKNKKEIQGFKGQALDHAEQ